MNDQRVRFVTYRHSHHSPHSGYDIVTQYMGGVIAANPLPRSIIRNRIMWRIANGVVAYDHESLATEIKAAWHMLKEKDHIYHILYGENTYHYLGFFNNLRRNRLIATFHLPPSTFHKPVRIDWHIRQLSAAICVGQSQLDFFADLLGRDKVFFVPMGVDTDYFSPPASFDERSSKVCLFVGTHLRDFATLRGVIELVTFQRPDVQFVAVIAPQNLDRVGVHPNVTLKTGIPEAEFLSLYRTAALMVMPLIDATANCALLEAMACGLPAVVTDVGSIRDYLCPECSVLTQLYDSRGMAEQVIKLLDDPARRQSLSEQARQQALKLAWPNVVKQLQSVYEAVESC